MGVNTLLKATSAMKVPKPSFNHKSDHHSIDTRLPNHWWANSCATLAKIKLLLLILRELGSNNNVDFLKAPI